MSLATVPVVRLDVVQRLVVAVMRDELGLETVMAHSDLPRPPRPYATLSLGTGPLPDQIAHESVTELAESRWLVDIPDPPTAGDELMLRVNGVPHRHTVSSGDTATDVRDVLVSSVTDDREPASASATGPAQLELVESAPGSLVYVSGSSQLTVAVADDSTQTVVSVRVARPQVDMRLQVLGADNRVGTAGAAGDAIGKIPMMLDLQRVRDRLGDHRMVLRASSAPVDLSGISGGGARGESRFSIDLRAGITSMYAEPIDAIETVEGSIELDGETASVTVEE